VGRKENPIQDTGPVGQFATRLRERREKVIPRPGYRGLAKLCHYSHSVLAEAAAGEKLPTWEVTEAYVRACGADDEEAGNWHAYWLETRQAVQDLLRKLGQASLIVPDRTLTGPAARRGRLRPVLADIAEPAQCQPHPDHVRTYEDLHYQLHVLRIAVGNPSLRELRRQMGKEYGLSTLSDIFAGHRTPVSRIFTAIVTGLLTAQGPLDSRSEAGEPWRSVRSWEKAWSQAEFNRIRPDLMRRRRYGNLVLATPEQDEGPTASVIAAMDPAVAAALLASLPATMAGRIISDMPPKEAQLVIKMMVELTSTTTPSPPAIPAPDPDTDPDDASADSHDTDDPKGKAG
jgi:hypothetical protein